MCTKGAPQITIFRARLHERCTKGARKIFGLNPCYYCIITYYYLLLLVMALRARVFNEGVFRGGQRINVHERHERVNVMTEYSTVSRIQDRMLAVLCKYPAGIARDQLFSFVTDVHLEPDERLEPQFNLALTGLLIRGKAASVSSGRVASNS